MTPKHFCYCIRVTFPAAAAQVRVQANIMLTVRLMFSETTEHVIELPASLEAERELLLLVPFYQNVFQFYELRT